MIGSVDIAAGLSAAVAMAGMAQAATGLVLLRRFLRQSPHVACDWPAVTLLKPLHGDEPLLEDALASCCRQDYPAFQILFGVQSLGDPALPVVERVRHRFPGVHIDIVVEPAVHGANRKIGNLINMLPRAQHDIVVIGDSDMHLAPDYLRRVVAALQQPGVGLVTSLYAGRAASDTLAARLGVAYINQTFLPGALLARGLGRQDCLGATMGLRRATLARVGGLAALADHLADDAVLGRLVRAGGEQVALARTVPTTTVPETHVPALFEHEVRWARTVKSLVPVEFALSSVQFPLFWATLCIGLTGAAPWAFLLLAVVWIAQAQMARAINAGLNTAPPLTIWWLPFRDMLSISVMLASYRTRRVTWRGQTIVAKRPFLASGKG